MGIQSLYDCNIMSFYSRLIPSKLLRLLKPIATHGSCYFCRKICGLRMLRLCGCYILDPHDSGTSQIYGALLTARMLRSSLQGLQTQSYETPSLSDEL